MISLISRNYKKKNYLIKLFINYTEIKQIQNIQSIYINVLKNTKFYKINDNCECPHNYLENQLFDCNFILVKKNILKINLLKLSFIFDSFYIVMYKKLDLFSFMNIENFTFMKTSIFISK